jgi:subtilisin family serine protease
MAPIAMSVRWSASHMANPLAEIALLDLVGLGPLMQRTQGLSSISVGVIDGPILGDHRDFRSASIRRLSSAKPNCEDGQSASCLHAMMVAGVLFARRGSAAPAICPGCTLISRPIFLEGGAHTSRAPHATAEALAQAIIDTVNAGARVINLSAGLANRPATGEEALIAALDVAARRETLVVAAAGNESSLGGSCITRHPWVIPVVGCQSRGRLSDESNLSRSIGRRGLRAPGRDVVTLGPDHMLVTFGGTSAACPFVTGTIALLSSLHPTMSAGHIKAALIGSRSRTSVVPPLLNAWDALRRLEASANGRRVA